MIIKSKAIGEDKNSSPMAFLYGYDKGALHNTAPLNLSFANRIDL